MEEDIGWMNGMYVGLLNDRELELFEKAVEQGVARRSYEGVGAFLGLARVRFNMQRTVQI